MQLHSLQEIEQSRRQGPSDCEKQTSLPALGHSMVEICDAGPHHDRYCMAFSINCLESRRLSSCRSDHTCPFTMTASGPGRLRKNSPVLTSTILDPSPGLDARARFEAAAQGGGISPLRSPHQAHTAAHTLSLTQEACPCRGEAVHGQRPMRGAAARTLEREPWTVSLSKASKLLAKVATIQGYQYQSVLYMPSKRGQR